MTRSKTSSIIGLTTRLCRRYLRSWTKLYASERKPSTNELEHWSHDAAQPRQVLAQWYLARSALRSGDQDKAIALFAPVRDSPVRLPALGEADLELAQLHLAKEQWDDAIRCRECGSWAESRSGFRGAG